MRSCKYCGCSIPEELRVGRLWAWFLLVSSLLQKLSDMRVVLAGHVGRHWRTGGHQPVNCDCRLSGPYRNVKRLKAVMQGMDLSPRGARKPCTLNSSLQAARGTRLQFVQVCSGLAFKTKPFCSGLQGYGRRRLGI